MALTTASSAEIKERVEFYLYFVFGLSRPVIESTLPVPHCEIRTLLRHYLVFEAVGKTGSLPIKTKNM